MESEITRIINDERDQGERLNALVDQIRRGRDAGDLLAPLRSENAEVVSIAAWILSELTEDLYGDEELVSALRDLTGHPDAMVRFHALNALFPFLKASDAFTSTLLSKLTKDQNEGVRKIADAAAARLGIT